MVSGRAITAAATVIGFAALSGCASLPDAARDGERPPVEARQAEPAERGELAPQTLREGQCAIFLWTASPPHRLVFFDNGSAARLRHGDRSLELSSPGATPDGPAGGKIERSHEGEGLTAVLSGVIGGESRAGFRIERAVLRITEPSGAAVVRPVRGVRSCRGQPGDPG